MSLEQQIPSSNCKRCVPRAFVNGETSDAYPKPPNPRSPCTSGHRTKKLTHPIEKDGQKGRQFKMFMKCALGRCAYTRHTSSELSRCAPPYRAASIRYDSPGCVSNEYTPSLRATSTALPSRIRVTRMDDSFHGPARRTGLPFSLRSET